MDPTTDIDMPKQLFEAGVKELFDFIGKGLDWGKEKGAALRATRKYLKTFTGRHGQVKVLGMSHPVPLSSIYTRVKILSPEHLRAFRSRDALERDFRRSARLAHEKIDKTDGLSAANEHEFLMVLGQPGAGKSTFLKRIGWEALQPENLGRVYRHHRLPVLIELNTFQEKQNVNLEDIIEGEFKICGFPDGFALAALDKGKLLVLLDGLDEVPGDKVKEVVKLIQDFAVKYEKNRFVVSCRTAFYKKPFSQSTDVLLADFDDLQIGAFIKNWFSSREDQEKSVAAIFWEMLKEPQQAAIWELARTPLLLTFLCLVYGDLRRLPDNRSQLYEEALRILLENWRKEKPVDQETIYEGFHTKLEIKLLEEIAGPAFEKDKVTFDQNELTDSIDVFFKNELAAPKTLDSTRVLEAIEVQQGILVQRANDLYTFSHLTLQEYLAASYFMRRGMTKITDDQLVDSRWRDMFLLMAGTGRADGMLTLMATTAREKAAAQPGFRALLRWANDVVKPGDGGQRLVRTGVAVLLGLFSAAGRAFAGDRDPARDIARDDAIEIARDNSIDLAGELARVIAVELAPDLEPAIERAPVRDLAHDLVFDVRRDLASDLNYIFGLVEELDKMDILKKEFSKRSREELAGVERPDQTTDSVRYEPVESLTEAYDGIMDALEMPSGVKEIPPDGWKLIANYFQAALLYVECKKEEMRVKKSGWDTVAEMIFRVPRD
jgi:hypothetical protein